MIQSTPNKTHQILGFLEYKGCLSSTQLIHLDLEDGAVSLSLLFSNLAAWTRHCRMLYTFFLLTCLSFVPRLQIHVHALPSPEATPGLCVSCLHTPNFEGEYTTRSINVPQFLHTYGETIRRAGRRGTYQRSPRNDIAEWTFLIGGYVGTRRAFGVNFMNFTIRANQGYQAGRFEVHLTNIFGNQADSPEWLNQVNAYNREKHTSITSIDVTWSLWRVWIYIHIQIVWLRCLGRQSAFACVSYHECGSYLSPSLCARAMGILLDLGRGYRYGCPNNKPDTTGQDCLIHMCWNMVFHDARSEGYSYSL